MILDSFDFAEEDFRQRQVIEARNEAETILAALDKGRQGPAWQKLSDGERVNIELHDAELRAVKEQDDYQAIRTSIEGLNQASMRLAELMMDSAVSSALKGKSKETVDVGEGPNAPHPFAKAEIKNSK
jgi:molecular chaperone DnaK